MPDGAGRLRRALRAREAHARMRRRAVGWGWVGWSGGSMQTSDSLCCLDMHRATGSWGEARPAVLAVERN